MHAHRAAPSPADVAAKANTLLAGLAVLKMAPFPLALAGLLLCIVAPLALVAVVGVLLATPLVLHLQLRSRASPAELDSAATVVPFRPATRSAPSPAGRVPQRHDRGISPGGRDLPRRTKHERDPRPSAR
jgi:hypothetical protein